MLRIRGWLFLASSLWASLVFAAGLSSLNTEELQAMGSQGAVIVDIRTPAEWNATGVIPGSQTLTFYDGQGRFDLMGFSASLSQLSPDPKAPVILVCRSGHRSEDAGKMLASQWPDRKFLHLEKGINEWIREGKPTAPPLPQKL